MSNLTGKVAIVTGSSKGIGAGIALRLAAAAVSFAVSDDARWVTATTIDVAGGMVF